MSEKLKPCPFCGSGLIKIKTVDKDNFKKKGKYYIECSLCGATSGYYNKRRDSANAWNTRAEAQNEVQA